MDAFKTALDAFLRNELGWPELLQALDQALAATPDSAEALRRQLGAMRDARKLSLQDYAKLDLHILQFDKQQAEQSVEEDRAAWRNADAWPEGWEAGPPFAAQPGAVLKNSFRLRERLARGASGEVWEAFDLSEDERQASERHVVLKLLTPEFRAYPHALKQFVQQIERYRTLQHPCLARIYDAGRAGGCVFVSLELLTGSPLNRLIETSPTGLPLSEVQSIVAGIAAALGYAYQNGLAHLDLTPDNIYYDPVRKQVKVVDYGLIKLARRVAQEQPGGNLGKLQTAADAYASCEALSELDKPEPADSVYSLACIAYELLSGNHPFGRTPCPEAKAKQFQPTPVKNLPPRAWQALLRGLALDRRQRTPTPAKFLAELFPQIAPAQPGRGRWILAAGLVTTLALAAGGYFGYQSWRDAEFSQAIVRGDPVSIAQLESLPPAQQHRLVQSDSALRQALLAFHLGRGSFGSLDNYHPEARAALFRDPVVQSKLVQHYQSRIAEAVAADNFDSAREILAELEQRYPQALPYADQRKELDTRQNERLAAATQKYQECLHVIQTPLHDRAPCLLQARQDIGQISPRHELLNDAELPKAFRAEAEKLLQAGAYAQAALILQDWAQLLPGAAPERDSLSWILARSQEIEQRIEADDFSAAESLLKEAHALYPESARFKAYDKDLAARRSKRLASLVEKYKGYLEQGKYLPDPDAEDLFDVRERILRIDAAHSLLKDAKLHQALFDRVVELAARDEDTLAKMSALFDAWKSLFSDPHYFTPADQEQLERAQNRVILRYLVKAEEFRGKKQTGQARAYLEFALSLSPTPSLREKIQAMLAALNGGP